MREDTPSRTAQWVAAARGLGMLLPDDERLADDPYGLAFASPRVARLVEERGPRVVAQLPFFKHWIAYMQVRTRLLDDAARSFATGGGRQVVLLGAGFDCRALRLHELADATVFEVDHPATQRHKRATLDKLGVTSPARYVTWDFEARPLDELADTLAAAGHDAKAPTLTIWEGVTMYLTGPAIDASLRAIAGWSADGSRLAMSYLDRSRIDAPSLANRLVAAAVATVGEPFRWGWRPDELPAYLAPRGWRLERDVSIRDAAQTLLPPALAASISRPQSRIAFAVASEHIAVAQP